MQIILALIVSILLIFLFWFIGHITKKELKINNEDQALLSNLISIAFGASSFLITINLAGTLKFIVIKNEE